MRRVEGLEVEGKERQDVSSPRVCVSVFTIFLCFNPHPRIYLLLLEREEGRKKERKREVNVRRKH